MVKAAIQVAGLFMAATRLVLMPRKYSGLVRRPTGGVLAGSISAGKGRHRLHDTGSISFPVCPWPLWDICLPGFQGAGQCVPCAGNFTLVPGTSIYNSVYYVIRNSRRIHVLPGGYFRLRVP